MPQDVLFSHHRFPDLFRLVRHYLLRRRRINRIRHLDFVQRAMSFPTLRQTPAPNRPSGARVPERLGLRQSPAAFLPATNCVRRDTTPR
jgi:hypothetical protein